MQSILEDFELQSEVLCESFDSSAKALVVIGYQRIYTSAASTTFGVGMVEEISQEYFRRQLRWMKINVDVLSEEDLRYCLAQPRAFPPRGVLLTFDGGYRAAFDLAYPVLKDEELPALFFIPGWLCVERRLGWWDLASYLVNGTGLAAVEWDGAQFPLNNGSQRTVLIDALRERFMSLQEAQTRSLLEDLARRLGTAMPPAKLQDDELMTFDQLREMAAGGMNIGAHPNSQRMLATPRPELQKKELIQSKRILEDQLGKRVRSLAYPVGFRDGFGANPGQLARESGYELAFSFHTGFNTHDGIDPYDIRRCFKHEPFDTFTESILYPHRAFGRCSPA